MSLINDISDELHKLNERDTFLMLSFNADEGAKVKLVTVKMNKVIDTLADVSPDYGALASGQISDKSTIQELFKKARAYLGKPN